MQFTLSVHSCSQNLYVELFKAYCLPIIMYSLEATWSSKTVTNMLDILITLTVKRIFQLRDYDLVDNIRQYVGLNNITQLCNAQKLKLMNRFSASSMTQSQTILNVCSHKDLLLFEMYCFKVAWTTNGAIQHAVYRLNGYG